MKSDNFNFTVRILSFSKVIAGFSINKVPLSQIVLGLMDCYKTTEKSLVLLQVKCGVASKGKLTWWQAIVAIFSFLFAPFFDVVSRLI